MRWPDGSAFVPLIGRPPFRRWPRTLSGQIHAAASTQTAAGWLANRSLSQVNGNNKWLPTWEPPSGHFVLGEPTGANPIHPANLDGLIIILSPNNQLVLMPPRPLIHLADSAAG